MVLFNRHNLADQLRDVVRPLNSPADVIAPVLDMVGDARIVMIGEASHGTEEFYDYRAEITKHLITDRGFTAVAVEADWPDAWRVNRYVRGFDDDGNAAEALAGFKRFPQWMWRNTVVLNFVNWLRAHNRALRSESSRAGFYGIDLYSLGSSMRAVLEYLDKNDPDAAKRARYRYSCLEDFGEDPQAYGYAASYDLGKSCENEVIQQLVELRGKAAQYAKRDGRVAADEYFYAEQNARLVKNAERYYRAMFEGSVPSWNLRDEHMADTTDALVEYLDRHSPAGQKTKVVVWAHNSHLGDASATEMGQKGEWNVGQLVRERWGDGGAACNIGFSTYTGAVTAADNWDEPAETKRVNPGLRGSYEELFHDVGVPNFLLRMPDAGDLRPRLREPRLQRAIGVIYRPRTERISHYFHARVADQFNAIIHLDETSALIPLDRHGEAAPKIEEETYPFGV
jgi:erythromycin esterase-like protein